MEDSCGLLFPCGVETVCPPQALSAMITRCHHRQPSNQWTVSRLAWRGSRCSWSALRMTASPTETADALWTWLRRVLSPGKWSVNKAFCFVHTHPASPTLLPCNFSSPLPFVYSRVSLSLYLSVSPIGYTGTETIDTHRFCFLCFLTLVVLCGTKK